MSTDQQIVELLSDIRKGILSSQSDYCDTDEAARIIGLDNTRYLKRLFEQGVLPRYPRGTGYKYKKTDCYRVAALLDNNQIKI